VSWRVARVGLTGWVNIPALPVVRIMVLSQKPLGYAVEKILKVPDQ
jgi:hypothetical protein